MPRAPSIRCSSIETVNRHKTAFLRRRRDEGDRLKLYFPAAIMDSSVAPISHRRSQLPSQTYRSLLHLCSRFDREPRVSLATPVGLQELVVRTEIAPENLSMPESRSDGGTGDSLAEKSLALEDIFDEIDLQDASVCNPHDDFFDEFKLMVNESEGFDPENCVNLFEALDVNDYGDDGMAKLPLDLAQNVAEKPDIATELQVDTVEGDKKVSEVVKSVEYSEVVSSGVLENNNERGIELEKPISSSSSTQVLTALVSQMVEDDDDDVEEGEISGDDDVNMLIEDDLAVQRNESRVSQELSVDVSNVDNGVKEMDPETSIKKRSKPSKEAKARKKAKSRKKRAQERIALGVKKLKLKPVAPKPKPIKYCRHYLKGRCHEGEKCKFSHDTTPETKSSPCCYFATQSCMKGDDCPYDHDLSKYPCTNFITKGFCHRGDNCLFSHKGTPQSGSDTPNANVTTSSTNIAAASFSSQKPNKQTVREVIAKLPGIQARVSNPVALLKPSSQSNKRNSSDASSPMINEHVTPPQIPPLRKPSVVPKGMSFLSLDKTSQEEDTVKPSTGSNQTLKHSQQRSFLPLVPPKGISFLSFASEEHKTLNQEPQEPASSRNLKTTPNSHMRSSLNSAMKLAAEFESAKAERCTSDPAEAVNKGDVAVNSSVARNSGNISSKILEFLSSFSHGKN